MLWSMCQIGRILKDSTIHVHLLALQGRGGKVLDRLLGLGHHNSLGQAESRAACGCLNGLGSAERRGKGRGLGDGRCLAHTHTPSAHSVWLPASRCVACPRQAIVWTTGGGTRLQRVCLRLHPRKYEFFIKIDNHKPQEGTWQLRPVRGETHLRAAHDRGRNIRRRGCDTTNDDSLAEHCGPFSSREPLKHIRTKKL